VSTVHRARQPVNVTVSVRGRNNRATVNVTVNPRRERRRLLRFGRGNAKLDDGIYTFSLPAGHFCPFADACRSRAHRQTGHIKDGPHTEFRCYAASNEARARSVRESRWRNAELLRRCKSKEQMTQLILESLSPYVGVVRIHVSGDFFTQEYLDAWLQVAQLRPDTRFYAYTKALPFWVTRLEEIGTGHAPGAVPNFILTASYGGTHDHLIEQHGLRFAKVVFSVFEAQAEGLPLDHDDSLAMKHGPSFALLLHGTQPPGSPAAKALSALWRAGEYGHGQKADAARRSLPLAF
jgi:hypothetical protein